MTKENQPNGRSDHHRTDPTDRTDPSDDPTDPSDQIAQDPRLQEEVAAHPYPLLFATVSGAHLYGFPSPDSDFDLRGAHLLPLSEVLGLEPSEETITRTHLRGGAEVDLVTHDVRKFFRLLLRDNGYVLEQLYSPLIVATTPEHAELKEIARGCITRRCLRHYIGFAWGQSAALL